MAWHRVSLVVAGSRATELAQALEAGGAISTELADADAGTAREQVLFAEPGSDPGLWPRCRVVALFPASSDVGTRIVTALAEAGCAPADPPAIDLLEDRDWVRETQRQFGPIRAGERLWIVPSWHEAHESAAVNLVLDPGAAFGTGSHPSTRLCLRWLERGIRGGETVLDYGCGSGILAIAAMKLGAGRAIAVDIDPLALEAARYNASVNSVALDVRAADSPLDGEAQITVANILANPLRMLAPLLAAHTATGGRLALAGVLGEQAPSVCSAYGPFFETAVAESEGDWVLIEGRRKPRR